MADMPHREGIDAPGRDHTTYILSRQDLEWRHGVRHGLELLYMLSRREHVYLATIHPDGKDTWGHVYYERENVMAMRALPATPGWHPTDCVLGRRLESLLVAMNLPALTDDQLLRPEELTRVRRLRAEMQHPDHPPRRVNRLQRAWWEAIVHGAHG